MSEADSKTTLLEEEIAASTEYAKNVYLKLQENSFSLSSEFSNALFTISGLLISFIAIGGQDTLPRNQNEKILFITIMVFIVSSICFGMLHHYLIQKFIMKEVELWAELSKRWGKTSHEVKVKAESLKEGVVALSKISFFQDGVDFTRDKEPQMIGRNLQIFSLIIALILLTTYYAFRI